MSTRTIVLSFLFSGLAFAQSPAITSGGVLNGASFAKGQAITPGSLVSIFGTNLASKTSAADTVPLSHSLGGVVVQFQNGNTKILAPMLFAQADDPANNIGGQLNVQVPWGIVPEGSSATVKVVVNNNGKISPSVAVQVAPFSPGVFSSNGMAIAQNPDGTLAWPSGVVPGLTTHPAKIGDVITVYATGLGAVQNTPADGHNSLDQLRNTITIPQILVGGVSAKVDFSGLSPQFVGVNQLNVTVPNVAPGDKVPFQIVVGGITTSADITMAVSP
ncbi:MAG TPA: hypothetical protein VFW44_21955 [Bryobacteraceae bacterium]|nr:hypothetical protein [Bryobacteraceae bacterium]